LNAQARAQVGYLFCSFYYGLGAFLEEFYPDYVSWRQRRKARKAAANTTPSPTPNP